MQKTMRFRIATLAASTAMAAGTIGMASPASAVSVEKQWERSTKSACTKATMSKVGYYAARGYKVRYRWNCVKVIGIGYVTKVVISK